MSYVYLWLITLLTFVDPMLFRLFFLMALINLSCSGTGRPDIVFEDFESGDYDKWEKLGVAFNKPSKLDSVAENIENVQGSYFAFSHFEGSGESYNQGKLVSKGFRINRKYIHLLIAGGDHETRECVNLIVNNKVVRVATGANDYKLRRITWDVREMIGSTAVLEVVDAIAQDFERNSLGRIVVDNIVFSDNKHENEVIFEDFESGTYNNWSVEGEAFEAPRNRTNMYYPISVNGFNGSFFAFSFGETHDLKQGKLTSKFFTIKHEGIKFLIGGGNHVNKTCINLVINDSVVFSQTGQNDGQMRWHHWDVAPYMDKNAKIEIVDNYSHAWGHIMVDDIIFYNNSMDSSFIFYLGLCIFILFTSYFIWKKLKSKNHAKPKIIASEEDIEKFEMLKSSIKISEIYKEYNPRINHIIENSGINEEDIHDLFERVGNTTLSSYINLLRVEEFKKQLKDPSNKAYTMLHIAENSGFNSKTSFYRVFKSVTKMTPSDYRKSLDNPS